MGLPFTTINQGNLKTMKRFLAIFVLLLAFATVNVQSAKALSLFDVSIQPCEHFDHVWSDRGSGADRDGAFYRPVPTPGFFVVGDYGQGNYGQPNGRVLCFKPLKNSALANPVDFARIWKDTGSGAHRDGSFWRPIPPQGYSCIGDVVQEGYAKPYRPDYKCLHNDLISPWSPEQTSFVWNDRGSGADADVSVYSVPFSKVIHVQGNYSPAHGPIYDLNLNSF
ncbi:MAG: Vps62-related protein [Moorea sp. SIO1F2]|uniref:Vps62-related protein n=1 Tax=Moorena sp. SIO1F2 TaxID=2607819 RepID=UPI0013BB6106|nr:Vps62-related protein [Moorena sp. SIO1F2]NET83174.1 Vps62-related protein [Moorena sp. SIO1F2]